MTTPRRTALIAASLAILSGVAGCVSPTPRIDPPAPTPAVSLQAPAKFTFSEKAGQVRGLLDKKNVEAAGQLLPGYLAQAPTDAGLLIQYSRFLVLTCDLTNPAVVPSPFIAVDDEPASRMALRAAKTAVRIDPDCASTAVDTVLHAFLSRLSRHLMKYGSSLESSNPRAQYASMINVALDVIKLSPEAAKSWSRKFEPAANIAGLLGKTSDAVLLGGLIGDLAQGGEGYQDFIEANRFFLFTLEKYKDHADSPRDALALYEQRFAEEFALSQIGETIDPQFAILKERVAH